LISSKKIPGRLAQKARAVDRALGRLLPSEKLYPAHLAQAMRYAVFSGGKRVRPYLALESARVCGAPESKVMPLAAAVEMIHAYSLVHDDLPAMDDDDFRRGRKTCHRQFDEATAILAGDALLTQAFIVLAEAKEVSEPRRRQVISVVGRAAAVAGLVFTVLIGAADEAAAAAAVAAAVALGGASSRRTVGCSSWNMALM
jgi:geranylgeranyl pyrophosphate synthase